MKYCRELEFDAIPNYNKLYGYIMSVFEEKSIKWDFIYDFVHEMPSKEAIKEIMSEEQSKSDK